MVKGFLSVGENSLRLSLVWVLEEYRASRWREAYMGYAGTKTDPFPEAVVALCIHL